MLSSTRPARQLLRQSIWTAESGVAAVEFALILPILLIIWLGGVEVTGALSVDRRINNLAASIGDLVARERTLTWEMVEDIFAIAPSAMFPHDSGDVSMRLTAVWVDANRAARVAWSRAQGKEAAYGVGASVSFLPNSLRQPETQVIMSEVFVKHRPAVGYVVTGDLQLEDRMFYVPRVADRVELCDKATEPKTCLK